MNNYSYFHYSMKLFNDGKVHDDRCWMKCYNNRERLFIRGRIMSEMIFSDPIKLNATRYAKKEAISFKDKRFTYAEFNERINQLSHALQAVGIQKGDKVAFMLYNCNELFEIIFACSKIGAIFVPINSRFIGREIKHVLDNSEASVLIYDIRFLSEVEKALAEDTSVKKSVTVGGGAQGSYEYESMI